MVNSTLQSVNKREVKKRNFFHYSYHGIVELSKFILEYEVIKEDIEKEDVLVEGEGN